MKSYLEIFERFDPPYPSFHDEMLGPEFGEELPLVSRLWFACGYRPGITAYLHFFLLRDFTVTHDHAYPPRFQSLRSMAKSFYRTDLFIRDVTDSGVKPTGGISSPAVRGLLAAIMKRHQRIAIPLWMMSCFGFSLVQKVEQQCAPLTDAEKRLHLAYMTRAFRIMGVPFTERRDWLEQFTREIDTEQAGLAPLTEQHVRHILLVGEMVGVPSGRAALGAMLPEAPRAVFESLHARVRPTLGLRLGARALGRLLLKRAVGTPRRTCPAAAAPAGFNARKDPAPARMTSDL